VDPARDDREVEADDELDDVVQEFLVESYENLDQLERDLLALEDQPDSTDALASVFRTVHTIKGTCGFLGYGRLESVAHVGENLLSKLRDRVLQLTPEMASALLSLSDALRRMLTSIEQTGAEGDDDHAALVAVLTRLNDPNAEPPVRAARAAPDAASPLIPPTPPSTDPLGLRIAAVEAAVEAAVAAAADSAAPEAAPRRIGDILVDAGLATHEQVAEAIARQRAGDPRHVGEILVEQAAIPTTAVTEALEHQHTEARASNLADTSIRVDVGLLDDLMTLVGELVLARNQIVQLVAGQPDAALTAAAQRLNLITSELQEGVMKTRMQPIGNLWSKLPRVVRDLAVSCGKRVRLEMEGEETELDKTIIEAIKDPHTHLVRNAVDHGVETEEARRSVGKAEEGRLLVSAYHEGGQVNIEVADDGAGIDPERIRDNAVAKGILNRSRAVTLGERELLDLVFAPGFSTAEQVTNVSGRGVGMDVVRTNIDKIGGTVDVQSVLGEGTTFRIKIPLTLAIIPALIVTSGGERYAIPQVSLVELVRVEGHEARNAVERIHGAPVYRLRGHLLPLVHLHRELGLADRPGEGALNIVVLQANDRQFGLVVESVRDTAEIVVKPLGRHLKGMETFAGATILGDGRVALILDVVGLAQRAHVAGAESERLPAETAPAAEAAEERRSLLLFGSEDDGRLAIPLASVDRLEEFPAAATEATGDQRVVQYRGEIMPLVDVASLLPERRRSPRRRPGRRPVTGVDGARDHHLQVVVHRSAGRRIGLLVERIHDIVEDHLDLAPPSRAGVLGTVVVHGRVTEVLDLPAALAAAGFADAPPPAAGTRREAAPTGIERIGA
jgi:two-component system chemotaxis sensor kinase CheA